MAHALLKMVWNFLQMQNIKTMHFGLDMPKHGLVMLMLNVDVQQDAKHSVYKIQQLVCDVNVPVITPRGG
ncbi:hypothetical protein MAR_014458 [Mya arenaria]|uniref:Uncharacterized protein n=1 Tax=Mya arenaria TaxID=6604 RepID=A0ABY7G5G8_MYAAR|nr:hypothetical protein MAR_014458 [Mya arenaria]